MELFVVRHTRPLCADGTCYGHTDLDVKDSFGEEAEALKAQLPVMKAVWSSPLRRCRVLSESLAGTTLLHFDDRLRELHFGEWENKPWSDLPLTKLNNWMENFVELAPPGGESFGAMYARVAGFINDLREGTTPASVAPSGRENEKIDSAEANNILIVTHAGVIRCLWHYITGVPLLHSFRIPVGFGEVLHLHLGKDCREDRIVRKG